MLDYIEKQVLQEVIAYLRYLPTKYSLNQVPQLFSALDYFPLQNEYKQCVNANFYSLADRCTTSGYPKTFHTSSFARRYARLLSNTQIKSSSHSIDDNLPIASATLNACIAATTKASSHNGGICFYPKNNNAAQCQYVPNYTISWLSPPTVDVDHISTTLDAFRVDEDSPWQQGNNSTANGERLKGSVSYEQLRVALIEPLHYSQTNSTGWYSNHLVTSISKGHDNNLIYTPLSTQIQSSIELRRAKIFLIAGSVNINIDTVATTHQQLIQAHCLNRQAKSINRSDIQLTPHLRIPRARPKPRLLGRGKTLDKQTSTIWDSGDLYQDIAAGYILAIIEDIAFTNR